MEFILQTSHVSKRFEKNGTWAVDDVSLSIKRGQIYGLLGQDRAGKTTIIRMIMGLIAPTKGDVEIFGGNPTHVHNLFARMGYLSDTPGFYPQLTVEEHLLAHCRLIGYAVSPERIEDSMRSMDLWDVRHTRAAQLSIGAKQRLGLARAIIHQPELLILDEPTSAIDQIGLQQFRQLLMELTENRKTTILLSSPLLREVQQVAGHIGIVHKGKLLEQSSFSDLKGKTKSYINLRVHSDRRALLVLEQEAGILNYEVTEPGVICVYERVDESAKIARTLIEHGIDLYEMNVQRGSFEEYYLHVIKESEHV